MKIQKKFWIRENRSIWLLTFISSLFACGCVNNFKSIIHVIWSNIYFTANYNIVEEGGMFEAFVQESRGFYGWIVISIMLGTFLLFHNMNQTKTKEWLGSMPLKQMDIFWYKFRQGVVSYTLPILFYGAGCIALMFRNRGWVITEYMKYPGWETFVGAEGPLSYMQVILMLWLWATAVYILFFFAQVIVRSSVMAALIGFGMTQFSGFIGSFLYVLYDCYKVEALRQVAFYLYRSYVHIFAIDADSIGSSLFGLISIMEPENSAGLIDYHILPVELVILFGVSAFFLLLAYIYFKKMNQPDVEGLFVSKLMRAFVLYGFSFSVFLPVGILLYDGVDAKIPLVSLIGVWPVAAVLAVLIHLLLRRRGY